MLMGYFVIKISSTKIITSKSTDAEIQRKLLQNCRRILESILDLQTATVTHSDDDFSASVVAGGFANV